MPTPEYWISLADLSAASLRLHPSDAAAVTRDITLRVQLGELPGIPSAHVLRFSHDGRIDIEGPMAAGRSVERAARLLEAMLPGFDAPAEQRVPGALRLVIARALGTLDLPPYRSLDEFADALARFAAPDPGAAVRAIYDKWAAAPRRTTTIPSTEPQAAVAPLPDSELTISDVRRARRATGLTLSQISERSRIPVSLLRELEWGYFVNWPADHYGRSQLVRYARAAGVDEQVVIRAVWPVLQESIRSRAGSNRVVDGAIVQELADNTSLVKIEPALPAVRTEQGPRTRRGLLAAAGIAALLTVALIPALWNSNLRQERPSAVISTAPSAPAVDGDPPDDAKSATAVSNASDTSRRPAATAQTDPVNPGAGAPARAPGAGVPTRVSGAGTPTRAPASARTQPTAPVAAAAQPAALRTDVAFSPAFASTGSAMFYHSGAGKPGDSSAIMRADTTAQGEVLRVTSIVDDNAANFHARPSPDGMMIAFDSDRDGERAVYIADANGRNVRRITGNGFAAVPSWSPDGRHLTYVRAEPNRPRVWNLWIVDLDTGESKRLTSHRYGQPWGAAWFPDGRRIAYSHEDRLIVRSIDGSTQRTYGSPKKGQLLRTPAVSPDGRRVMFQVYRDGAWMLDLSDGSMRRILTDPTAEEFTWSPDGRRVAYHSRKTGAWGVWLMAAR